MALARPHMTRVEQYNAQLRRLHSLIELRDEHNWNREQVGEALALGDEPSPFSLHRIGMRIEICVATGILTDILTSAFEAVIQSQATPEFLAKWDELIANAGIIG